MDRAAETVNLLEIKHQALLQSAANMPVRFCQRRSWWKTPGSESMRHLLYLELGILNAESQAVNVAQTGVLQVSMLAYSSFV